MMTVYYGETCGTESCFRGSIVDTDQLEDDETFNISIITTDSHVTIGLRFTTIIIKDDDSKYLHREEDK